MNFIPRRARAIAIASTMASFPLHAVTPLRATVASQTEWNEGELSGLRLAASGEISLGPRTVSETAIDESIIWSLAPAAHGATWVGTGAGGRLLRVDPDGTVTTAASFDELQVTALDPFGDIVFATTAPDGAVYRVERGKSAQLVARLPAVYAWALSRAGDGTLYVATGIEGRIYAVKPDGSFEVYRELPDTHIVSLIARADGSLVVGSADRGLVIELGRDAEVRVLYDSAFKETKGLAIDDRGRIYAAINGGPSFRDATAPPPPGEASVTVSAGNGESARPAPPTLALAPPEALGDQSSEIVRISSDAPTEIVARTRGEIVHGLAVAANGEVWVATTKKLLVIGSTPQPDVVVLSEGGQVSAIARAGDELVVGTTNPARFYRVADGIDAKGVYTAKVIAADADATWGAIETLADIPSGCYIEFETRSGGTLEPDSLWSDWMAVENAQIGSPAGRFLQWRATLGRRSGTVTPRLRQVAVAYRPDNARPEIANFTAQPSGVVFQRATGSSGVVDSVPPPLPSMFRELAPARAEAATTGKRLYRRGAQTLTWEVSDANGDELQVRLSVRAMDSKTWLNLTDRPEGSAFTFETEALPDGFYIARLEMSDLLANSATTALTATRDSDPFLIDNTPPKLALESSSVRDRKARLKLVAEDASSALWKAEQSLDGGRFEPLEASDRIPDGRRENFEIETAPLASGEHFLVIRVYDLANQVAVLGQRLVVP